MKKREKKKDALDAELADLDRLVGEHLPVPGQGTDLRPAPGEDSFVRQLMDEERALLNPEEWGIDVLPLMQEQLGPLKPEKELNDDEISSTLRWMILILAQHHLCLTLTNHLTERELYRFILKEVLPHPIGISRNPEGGILYHDCCPCGSEEYMAYYGDEFFRDEWRDDYNEEPPEKRSLASDRDRWLEMLAEAHRHLPLPEYETEES